MTTFPSGGNACRDLSLRNAERVVWSSAPPRALASFVHAQGLPSHRFAGGREFTDPVVSHSLHVADDRIIDRGEGIAGAQETPVASTSQLSRLALDDETAVHAVKLS